MKVYSNKLMKLIRCFHSIEKNMIQKENNSHQINSNSNMHNNKNNIINKRIKTFMKN